MQGQIFFPASKFDGLDGGHIFAHTHTHQNLQKLYTLNMCILLDAIHTSIQLLKCEINISLDFTNLGHWCVRTGLSSLWDIM